MRKCIQSWIVVGCICLLTLCSCSNVQEMKSSKIHVGVLCYDQSDTFLGEMLECFKGQFEKDGIDAVVTVYDAAGSQRTQEDQLKDMIDMDYDVWCVNLVDRTNTSSVIDEAKERNIPVIFFNREPVSEDLMQWDKLYYIGAEAKQSGVLQGKIAAEKIKNTSGVDRNKDEKIQYVVLEGEAGHQDAIIRTENAVNTLKENGIELEKLGSGIANWNRAQGQNRMLQLITQYQNKIELVLANNDDMALGAIDAYEKLGYTESDWPVIFGVDGTKEGLEAVSEGKLSGTVYNDKEGQAKAMEQLATALALGNKLDDITFTKEKYIYLPYYEVNDQNMEQYMK